MLICAEVQPASSAGKTTSSAIFLILVVTPEFDIETEALERGTLFIDFVRARVMHGGCRAVRLASLVMIFEAPM
ncbi:MAG: hypothetical protein ACN6O5_19185 [Achromobacter sp.]|uniref:hypothetical protein n=1 Tax=Achromobacter sp. TaxID=134375 RepID=UPI003D0676F2